MLSLPPSTVYNSVGYPTTQYPRVGDTECCYEFRLKKVKKLSNREEE